MWHVFDYRTIADGTYWVACEKPEYDVDVDDYGNTIGTPTGDIERSVCLVEIYWDMDDQLNILNVQIEGATTFEQEMGITHCAKVEIPSLPTAG